MGFFGIRYCVQAGPDAPASQVRYGQFGHAAVAWPAGAVAGRTGLAGGGGRDRRRGGSDWPGASARAVGWRSPILTARWSRATLIRRTARRGSLTDWGGRLRTPQPGTVGSQRCRAQASCLERMGYLRLGGDHGSLDAFFGIRYCVQAGPDAPVSQVRYGQFGHAGWRGPRAR